MRRKAHS